MLLCWLKAEKSIKHLTHKMMEPKMRLQIKVFLAKIKKKNLDVVPWTKNNNLTLWFLQCFHLEVLVLEVVVVLVVREGPLGLTTYLVR